MVKLTIPGPPVALQRHRHTKSGHTYLPKQSVEYRERIQTAWRVEGKPCLDGPLVVAAMFFLPRPPSHFKKSGGLTKGAPKWPRRPDLSNLLKACEDALDGCLWQDDSQIVCISGLHKTYCPDGLEPHTLLTVWESRRDA